MLVVACGAGERAELAAPAPVAIAPPTTNEPVPLVTTTANVPVPTSSLDARSIVIAVAGDTSLTQGLDGRDPFGAVAGVLGDADLAIVNLETVVSEPGIGTAADKQYVFRSPPRTAELLAAAGVDVVSVANNHALDLGIDGLARTLELLDASGLISVGAGTRDQAYAPAMFDIDGFRVAVIGASRVLPNTSWMATETGLGLASAYDGALDHLDRAVSDASSRADVVIVMIHWGVEKDVCPAGFQEVLGSRLIERGADVVVGSHPHVLQSVERSGDGWIIHSTGNLAFPSARDESARSAVFLIEVAESSIQIGLVPLQLDGGRPAPVDADGWLADRALGWVDSGGVFVATDALPCSS